ncbi:MAG TPA: GGDEF domain-containing protein [Candidatus Pacearchaeota archaeon]|nr:GGDEF domain-containing protein [Candidatus Pacearchaeota archaeon]
MDKRFDKLNKKISALDPRFRAKIEELFSAMTESVSLLYDAATRDEKTGLYNSRFFENMLDMEFEKAGRGQQKLSLFIIDIDFFKKVNDKHGHIKADEFLVRLSKILQKQFRRSDVVSRFGGEEFIILLPETNIEKAKRITSRLRSAVKSDKILKKHGITISGGLTQYKKGDTKKKLKKRADKALYKAKNTGRDKFVVLK